MSTVLLASAALARLDGPRRCGVAYDRDADLDVGVRRAPTHLLRPYSALAAAEQQIQRYEANDYRSTSLARLCDIANALGVTVAQHGELKPSAA